MKTKSLHFALAILGFITWSCTNTDELAQGSLKTSINTNAQELTVAINAISNSPGYQVLATSDFDKTTVIAKSAAYSPDPSVVDSILLTDINGVYDYNKANTYRNWKFSLLRYFEKTAESSHMVVRLPEEKVKNPRALNQFSLADTLLVNNYVIDLSDYQYRFNRYLWDYQMASTINIKGLDAGALSIQSSFKPANGYHFASEFVFANGYLTKCDYTSGDTARSVYSISKAGKIYYEEKFVAIKTKVDKRHRETEYSLTIGDVQITRKLGKNSLDSAKIYVAGVLQTNSKIEIVDVVTDSAEVCLTNHKRELKITFDDGTSTTINQLLSGSIDDIRTLFVSLRQTYFATSIVDRIAFDIYLNKTIGN